MNPPRLGSHLYTRTLLPSEGMENTVAVAFATINEEIDEDPATGIQTLIKSSHVDSSFFFINFSIRIICRSHIRDLLIDRLMNNHSSRSESLARDIPTRVWEALVSRIASAASNLGFGTNGFAIILVFTTTHERVSVVSSSSESPPLLHKLVLEGKIDGEELKKLKMETEPCSICLEDLSVPGPGAGVPTRMPCSHVFHDRCLLEWFRRKITCPMCRRLVSLFHMKQLREGWMNEVFNRVFSFCDGIRFSSN